MANSLLAHLYTRIRGSQEDIATLSLQYIVMQSDVLNRAFTQYLANSLGESIEDVLEYTCQDVGVNKERPDMVGKDRSGKDVLLCEMKFYAGLTANQPLGYLDRIEANKGKGLIFVCPEQRKANLWTTLKKECKERTIIEIKQCCMSINGIKLSVVTWNEILACLIAVAIAKDKDSLADIKQLEGYCLQMDSEAFLPFSKDDFSAKIAVAAERYYRVIDEIAELLYADRQLHISKKGTKISNRYGYERKLNIGEITIRINFDRLLWKDPNCPETPFWLTIQNEDNEDFIHEKYKQIPDKEKGGTAYYNYTYIALYAPADATLDEICIELKKQIIKYLHIFAIEE